MDEEIDKKKDSEKLKFLMISLRKRLYKTRDQACSNKIGEKAVELILNNDFMGALGYFKEAININPSDVRHYLNRSYCYLHLRKYALALADVSFVLKESNVPAYLFIANLRAGQAESGLMEYKKAAEFFREAISIDLDSPYPRRELMRLKINCFINAGYSETDALSTIEMSSVVDDFLNFCTDKLKVQNDLPLLDNLNDDLVYSSDDDNEPSNCKILNKILNYEPGKIKFHHIADKLSTVSVRKKATIATMNENSTNKNSKKTTKQNSLPSNQGKELIPEDKSPTCFSGNMALGKLEPNSKRTITNNLAIWVGNLDCTITESMLKKLFSQYGCIASVHRPPRCTYGFIHFFDESSVKWILQYSEYHLHGTTLIVRPATANMH